MLKTTRFGGSSYLYAGQHTIGQYAGAVWQILDAANLALELILRSGVADVEISNWRRI
jgi:hypothetical protein